MATRNVVLHPCTRAGIHVDPFRRSHFQSTANNFASFLRSETPATTVVTTLETTPQRSNLPFLFSHRCRRPSKHSLHMPLARVAAAHSHQPARSMHAVRTRNATTADERGACSRGEQLAGLTRAAVMKGQQRRATAAAATSSEECLAPDERQRQRQPARDSVGRDAHHRRCPQSSGSSPPLRPGPFTSTPAEAPKLWQSCSGRAVCCKCDPPAELCG